MVNTTSISVIYYVVAMLLHAEPCLEQALQQIRGFAQQIQFASSLDGAFAVVTSTVREILGSDRALVYQLLPDGDGVVIAEAVGDEWRSLEAWRNGSWFVSGEEIGATFGRRSLG